MTTLNDEMQRQILVRFPELQQLVEKVNKDFDGQFFRDAICIIFLLMTSRFDREVLGSLTRMLHTLNVQLDQNQKNPFLNKD